MANTRITREQLKSFCKDDEMIRAFEELFSQMQYVFDMVSTMPPSVVTESLGAEALAKSTVTLDDGVGVAVGTLTNAPAATDPVKWIPINDNGTTRWVPTW